MLIEINRRKAEELHGSVKDDLKALANICAITEEAGITHSYADLVTQQAERVTKGLRELLFTRMVGKNLEELKGPLDD